MAGVQAGSAGRLSIEIYAEVARIQADMDKVRRLIKSAGSDIASTARAANDNLSGIGKGAGAGIQQFSRDVAQLKAALDPAWAAQQRFNDQQRLGMQAFKAGAIDRQQFIAHMRQINSELNAVQQPMQRVTASAGQQKQGMQQLSFQLNDVATQFASGTPPMQIFAQQAGQTLQAVQLMTGGSSKLATFLAGPWGAAIIAATSVLVPFIAKLWDTFSASNAASAALQGLMNKRRQEVAERTQISTATKDLNRDLERRNQLEAEIAKRGVRGANGQLMFVYKQQQELKEVNARIFETRDAIDSQRVSAINLDQQMAQLATANMKAATAAGGASKAFRGGGSAMRAAKTDADDFALSLAKVAQGLTIFQRDAFGDLVKQMDALDEAAQQGFDRQLAADNAERTRGLTEAADATALWNEQLDTAIDYLGRIGGLAGGIGEVAAVFQGLASGNLTNLPGKTGALIGMLGQTDNGRDLIDGFRDVLDDTFGGNGTFLKAIQGAGVGAGVGGILFGGSPGSQLGAMFGGALGETFSLNVQKVATSVFGKTAGKILGGISPVLGAIAGGLIGKIFGGGDKYGSVSVTNGLSTSKSNNSNAASGATQLSSAINDGLAKIASSLGGTLGDFAYSIGVTNNRINYNPGTVNGKIGTKWQSNTIDFGQDSEAAIKKAIADMIEQGAIQGVRAGTLAILKAGSDIETQLGRAQQYEQFFNDYQQAFDPQGFDLAQLDKWNASIRDIISEAGGMAEDFAKAEELYQKRRLDIVEQYTQDTLDIERQARQMDAEIARLQGDDIKATTIARQLEREQIDETLRARYDLIASLQDEAQAAADAAAASDRVLSLQQRYSRAIGDDATAKALERMQELNAAQTEQERSMLAQIHAIDDAMEAQEALANSYTSMSSIMGAIATKTYEMTASLRDFADSILGRDDVDNAQARYLELVNMAAAGDQAALAKLPAALEAYLEQAKGMSSSFADYQRSAAWGRQVGLDVADVADARATANFVGSLGPGWSENLAGAMERMQAELVQLRETVAKGNDDRVNLSIEQLYATKEQTRILDDATEGGYGMKTQPVPE